MFMLDTNICICLLNRRTGYESILARIDGIAYGQLVISSITLAELKYGIAKYRKKPLIVPSWIFSYTNLNACLLILKQLRVMVTSGRNWKRKERLLVLWIC